MTNALVASALEKHFGIKPKHETDVKKAEHGKHKKAKGESDATPDQPEDSETS